MFHSYFAGSVTAACVEVGAGAAAGAAAGVSAGAGSAALSALAVGVSTGAAPVGGQLAIDSLDIHPTVLLERGSRALPR